MGTVLVLAVLAGASSPQITGEPLPPAAPLADQEVTLEFGERGHPSALTLCNDTGAVVLFRSRIEEQIYLVMESYRTGLPEGMRRLAARTIVAEAKANKLDPWLVVGLMRVESAFYNYAVSNKDAMGLMQILPYVGHAVADDIGVEWNGPETLFHPVKNIKIGTHYLARLESRFGNMTQALQAYNLGPTRLSRWLRNGRGVPTEYSDAVESYHTHYGMLKGVPREAVRTQVAAAERRYRKEKASRVTASLVNTKVLVTPEDLQAALEAGVKSVDDDAGKNDALSGPPVPEAPHELSPAFAPGDSIAPPIEDIHGVFTPAGPSGPGMY